MPLQPGSKIGAYEVVAVLGAGGMGEVYRARDGRLNRNVAIKTINAQYAADPEGLRRFELEARALAALNHPNLLAIYDLGSENGTAYIVSELLEGETLRTRMQQGPIPLRRAIEYARQIVRALVAAHEKAFVHRDLKPENIFLTKDGQVKLLDFGLAKLVHPVSTSGDVQTVGVATITIDTGKVMGTPGYMSPEQLRGQAVDFRSDIFSFGAVLHEMLCGRRAFAGATTADLVSATLTAEPDDLTLSTPSIPPSTVAIIRHCLEKRPEDRFQSARDLLFDLESLAVTSASGSTAARRDFDARNKRLWLFGILGAVGLAASMFFALRWLTASAAAPLSFTQITFRRASIWYARLTADGNTVLFNASWADRPLDIFSARVGSTESRSLGIANADLLSVSSTGELAVLLRRPGSVPWFERGTLARVPMGGGSPREILEEVESADWSPDGANLAVVHQVDGQQRLEYPIGKILLGTQGWLTDVAVSPKGDQVAFMDHPTRWDDRGNVSVVDLDGRVKRLTEEFASERGLAWSPDGRAIWFTATRSGEASALYETTLKGKVSLKYRAPINVQLHDIAQNGWALISTYHDFTSVIALPPGQTSERDLSWLDNIYLFDLSADGKTFLYQYYGAGSGPNYTSYLAKTDGSPPLRLGEGAAVALSPDGKWVVTILYKSHQTLLQPTGAGQTRPLNREGLVDEGENAWAPDGQHVLFTGTEAGHASRCYIQDINGGKPQPLCPEGVTRARMSPDGKLLVAREGTQYVILRADGTDKRNVNGLEADEEVLRWSEDSRTLLVCRPRGHIQLFRLDPATGKRQLLHDIIPTDPAGIISSPAVLISADGKSYIYHVVRKNSQLFVIKHLPG